MSELRFACPLCAQQIECGGEWAGQQIQCPICQGAIVVPAAPAPPPPPARPGGTRLAATNPAERAAPALPSVMAGSELKLANSLAEAKHEKIKRIAMIAVGVIVLGVGCYFGIPAVMKWQTQLNLAQKKDLDNADGGEVGHLKQLNDVLDATDPARMQPVRDTGSPKPRKSAAPPSNAPKPDTTTTTSTNEPPAPPPEWTLDVEAMNIPKSKVNGWLAGTNFTPENAYLDISGSRHTLTLRQGTNFYADRELVVFLRLKTGQAITNSTWTVAKDDRTGVPSVVKRWKSNPRYAPQQKSFANGYALKLEFGKAGDGIIPGKIFAALPDPEQSVVAGRFNAKIRVVTNTVPIAVPGRPTTPPPYRRQ